MTVKLATVLVAALVGAAVLLQPATGFMPPPTVTIQLPPASSPSRPLAWPWAEVLNVTLGRHGWAHSFGPVFAIHNASLFNNLPTGTLERLEQALATHFPDQHLELLALSSAFAALGYPVAPAYLAGWVYFHELAHTDLAAPDLDHRANRACTAILARSADGQHVYHGRNMDQDPAAGRNLTVEYRFVAADSGALQVVAVDWYTIVTAGFMTALVPGVASVQENWRFSRPPLSHTLVLGQIDAGLLPQVYLFRQAMLNAPPSFASIVAAISSARLAAPMYAAVGGRNGSVAAGLIVTKAASPAADPPQGRIALDGQRWGLVQTNYDHFLPDPADDPRRSVAEAVLFAQPQAAAATGPGVLSALWTPPVLNSETLYSVLMTPTDPAAPVFAYVHTP